MKFRIILLVSMFLPIDGCVEPVSTTADTQFVSKKMQEDLDKARARIGHIYWADRIELCDSPALTGDCTRHWYHTAIGAHRPYRAMPASPPYGPFEVTDVIADATHLEFFYAIKGPDGETKYSPLIAADDRTFLPDNPSVKRAQKQAKATAACNHKGGVSIGMTKQQVLASCWGKPNHRNVDTYANGTKEQWVYGGGYVYFRDDVVEAISTRK